MIDSNSWTDEDSVGDEIDYDTAGDGIDYASAGGGDLHFSGQDPEITNRIVTAPEEDLVVHQEVGNLDS